ncbi:DoxX family protein [Larkinella bovis]|uniref:DoxX family protein n=1 Tax=Larkinella bovis TaxID=683041 RepID=A0ABW0IFX2_9BACT
MKKTKILYWVFTGLFSFAMFGSAIPNILVDQGSLDLFKTLGLPAYLIPFIGWAKALGVIAILIPGFPRLKEWAYAGLSMDLVGATYCIYHNSKNTTDWLPMLAFLVLAAVAYGLYIKKQRIAGQDFPENLATKAFHTAS